MTIIAARTLGALLLVLVSLQLLTAQTPTPQPRRERAHTTDGARLAWVRDYLESKAAAGAFPGAVLVVGVDGRIVFGTAVGVFGQDDGRPVSDTTIYDLASLTKVVGLTTATMLLVADGRLTLDDRVVDHLPSFVGPQKDAVRVRHLLTHTSGMETWVPLHLETASREEALARVNGAPLLHAPGERYAYSDLGAIVLTQIVEAVTGEPLDRLLARRVFEPLGMQDTRFRPPAAWRDRIAPTERDPWRKRLLHGEVHDENTARLGGVSGHAGLFSSARDLAMFAQWVLDAYHGRIPNGTSPYVPSAVVREFTRKQPGPAGSTRALGWDTPSPGGGGSAGHLLSLESFGHTGFTGTSIWIDPERELFLLLLTNRVHPTRSNNAIRRVRAVVADSVVAALGLP